MGTNFYWLAKEHAPCPHCGRADEREELHIGKSSAGWCFALHVVPEAGINSLDDWKARFAQDGSVIRDEYGDTLTPDQMLERITKREGRPWEDREKRLDMGLGWALGGYKDEAEFHYRNHSERGPNGLLRHRIDGSGHCIAHGEGTWDHITGAFS